MKRYLFVFAMLVSILNTSFAQSWPVCIMHGDYADPSIMREGGDFYMTHSAFDYNPGFLIWHSRDLVNWEPICRVVTQPIVDAWAPDLQKVGDKYYLYYPYNGKTYVCIASNIRGPWTDPIEVTGSQGIDPGLIVDQQGKRYLWVNNGNFAPLNDEGTACLTPFRSVYHGWDIPQDWVTEGKWPEKYLESPKLIYHGGYYYLTCAEGGTAGPATSHMCVSARSKSIEGPWENSPYNPVIHTWSDAETWWSKGHGTLIDDADGNWWIIYHSYAKDLHTLGRMTLIEPIEWTPDGWFRASSKGVFPGNAKQDLTHGNNAMYKGEGSWLSDDFSSRKLGLQWAFYRENATDKITLGKGRLIMPGKGSSPADARYLLITAEDAGYQVSVEVKVGDSPAGLMLFYNKDHFCGVSLDSKNIYLYEHNKTVKTMANTIGKKAAIRLVNDHNRLTMEVAPSSKALSKGTDVTCLATDIDISDMNHNRLGSFLALRPGLMSQGTGKAEFARFRYEPKTENRADRVLSLCHKN